MAELLLSCPSLRRPGSLLFLLALVVVLVPCSSAASEIPGAVIVVETTPGSPGSDPASAPPRFVLLKDGQVFVGGTAHLQAGRLEKDEVQALRRRAAAARKAAGRNSQISFAGDEDATVRLRLPEDGPTDLSITGDPAQAPANLQPVAALVRDLLAYDHPSLAPYRPASYALHARAAGLRPGGCRSWSFSWPIEQALESPRVVSAADAVSWPSGAVPASVCVGDKRYLVTLRPLLPGEQP